MDDRLRTRWERLTGLLDVGEADAVRVLRDLWRRYDEPHRAYHRLPHIRHVLDVLDLLRAEEHVEDPVAVQLAAWFHDAVYEPGRSGNERRSADLAGEVLRGWGLSSERVAHVRELILATESHVARSPDAAALVDADLAILAADPDTYDVYRRAVRVEYGHLDEAAWRSGRAGVLQRFLDRDAIFATAALRARGEAAARRNLEAELADLG